MRVSKSADNDIIKIPNAQNTFEAKTLFTIIIALKQLTYRLVNDFGNVVERKEEEKTL